MKKNIIISIISVFCYSCSTHNSTQKFPSGQYAHEEIFSVKKDNMLHKWDGQSPLWQNSPDKYDSLEPVCIIVYERTPGLKEWWYPSKITSSTTIVRQIMDKLNYPEFPNQYNFYTDKYILVLFVGRGLTKVESLLIPFMEENKKYILLPNGRDRSLYEILNNISDKENYFGETDMDLGSNNGISLPEPNEPFLFPGSDF